MSVVAQAGVMRLEDCVTLVDGSRIEGGGGTTVVRGLAYDSRRVEKGDLFFAVPGFKDDGAAYVVDAVGSGAVAVVAEGPVATPVPLLRVPSVREAMGRIAARFFSNPSAEMLGVGVTGTNGKTTTASLLASVLSAAGRPAGLVGTITYRVGTRTMKAPRTTPEAIDLQRMLREMVTAGNQSFVMEVSSHAIALQRTMGLSLAAMIFTNLTRDHLDFHGTMEAYYDTKRRFFRRDDLAALASRVGAAVINIDDPYGERLARETDLPVTTFGRRAEAAVRVEALEESLQGSRLRFETPRGALNLWLPLPGRFHQMNALAVVAATAALDLPYDAIVRALETIPAVPGRFQLIDNNLGFAVVVDYAHSPDGIASLLAAVRPLAKGRIITLFGCGGDRDRGKRPLMGEAAGRGSDFVILTSDNPRSEHPQAIIAEAEVGLRATGTPYSVCADRRDAIALALAEARPGDAVIIAGKGHEDYQEIGATRLPFQDAKVVQELIDERGRAESKGKARAPRDTSGEVNRDPNGTARDERRG